MAKKLRDPLRRWLEDQVRRLERVLCLAPNGDVYLMKDKTLMDYWDSLNRV